VIPTDRNGQLWIHFAPHDKDRYISAVDVLEGRVPPDRVAQRLVLIGTSAVGLLDSKTTPVDPLMPGVEVHAQVLENILTNSVLSRRTMRSASSYAPRFFSASSSSGWRQP
jgi:adenylate cyclase